MSRIRPEQMGHKSLLRRGRNTKPLQYTLLAIAAGVAGAACFFALTL